MVQICIRLSPELSKMLHAEAQKLSASAGKTVTVSDLIRTCIGENFPQAKASFKSETAALVELPDQVAMLTDRATNLENGVEDLVKTLSKVFPMLATREQVDSLTDALAAVLAAMKEG